MNAPKGAGQRQQVLVIGVGNAHRGDDAVGLLAAQRIEKAAPEGLRVARSEGEVLRLLDTWDSATTVIVIDALCSEAATGSVRRFDVSDSPLPGELGGCSTHGVGLGQAVEIARNLGRLPERLIVFGVEGRRYGIGDEPSPEVLSSIGKVVDAVLQEVQCTNSP